MGEERANLKKQQQQYAKRIAEIANKDKGVVAEKKRYEAATAKLAEGTARLEAAAVPTCTCVA